MHFVCLPVYLNFFFFQLREILFSLWHQSLLESFYATIGPHLDPEFPKVLLSSIEGGHWHQLHIHFSCHFLLILFLYFFSLLIHSVLFLSPSHSFKIAYLFHFCFSLFLVLTISKQWASPLYFEVCWKAPVFPYSSFCAR